MIVTMSNDECLNNEDEKIMPFIIITFTLHSE